MKQLVVLSGKGGAGKTSVTAALAHLASTGLRPVRAVLADADVDAANLELVLEPRVVEGQDFWGGQVAVIDQAICIGGGDCAQVCRFEAIYTIGGKDGIWSVDPIACDGCAACVYQCPTEAISMHEQIVGEWYRSESRFGPLFHAALRPAQENSGKLVTLIKQHARLLALDESYELVLVDGPPGIGCPVISAASGADLALIVVEPTLSGVHDMQRIIETSDHFGLRALVCVNKADIHPAGREQIEAFCQERGLELAGHIPYDTAVTEAMVQGAPVTEYYPDSEASRALRAVWAQVLDVLGGEGG